MSVTACACASDRPGAATTARQLLKSTS